jgi:lipopolysaccharide transport system permease protein
VAWAVLQPLALMAVFTVFFGRLAGLEREVGVPYHLFAYAGLLPWQLFSRVLSESSHSLVADQRLVSKVYFPRILVPFASCTAALVDFAIGSVLLAGLMLASGVAPRWTWLSLPLYLLLMLVVALGIGFWLSALNTRYRDVGYAIPFLVQFWMFVTPVVYPAAIVPERWRWLLGLNPMTGVLEGVRSSLFGAGAPLGATVALSAAIGLVLFVSGIYWFRWLERTFVDSLGGQ